VECCLAVFSRKVQIEGGQTAAVGWCN